jgi:hypothetical protein
MKENTTKEQRNATTKLTLDQTANRPFVGCASSTGHSACSVFACCLGRLLLLLLLKAEALLSARLLPRIGKKLFVFC